MPRIVTREPWMAEALCKDRTDLFFPPADAPQEAWVAAKAVCAACPVIAPCLDFALATPEREGCWGGTSPTERKALRRERRQLTRELVAAAS